MDRLARAFREFSRFEARRDAGRAEPTEEFLAGHPKLRDLLEGLVEQNESALALGVAGQAIPPLVDPVLGTLVGDYRIKSTIGQGGMGTVYLAELTKLGRDVALKIIRPDRLRHSVSRARFQREAKTNARLDHPGICRVFDIGEHDGLQYFAMQHIDGEDLASRIARARSGDPGSTVDRSEVLRLFVEIARALHFAHEHGVVHRDVKPANIMVTSEGRSVVLDFGLAATADADEAPLTATGDRPGTPAYMAPELLLGRGGTAERTVDVWALGVTLFEALTTAHPFEGSSIHELEHSILHSPPLRPSALRSSSGRDLWIVIGKCLEKDPRRRYSDCAQIADELARVLAGQPIVSRSISSVGRTLRWCRRNRLATALLLTLAATSVGAWFTARIWDQLEREREVVQIQLASSQFAKAETFASNGQWHEAAAAFSLAAGLGHGPFACLLGEFHAAEALGDEAGASACLSKLLAIEGVEHPKLMLLFGDPTRRYACPGFDRPSLDDLEAARTAGRFRPADAAYVAALTASNLRAALASLRIAINLSPRYKVAREMLVSAVLMTKGPAAALPAAEALLVSFPDDQLVRQMRQVCRVALNPDAPDDPRLDPAEHEVVRDLIDVGSQILDRYRNPVHNVMRMRIGTITRRQALFRNAVGGAAALTIVPKAVRLLGTPDCRPPFRLAPAIEKAMFLFARAPFSPGRLLPAYQEASRHADVGIVSFAIGMEHAGPSGEHLESARAFEHCVRLGSSPMLTRLASLMAANEWQLVVQSLPKAERAASPAQEQAVQALASAVMLVGESPLELEYLAIVAYENRHLDLCEEIATRLRRVDPTRTAAYIHLANIADARGLKQSARAHVERAEKLSPKSSAHRQRLARAIERFK